MLRLKEFRRRRNLSQEGLARQVGIHPRTIQRYENGEVTIPIYRLAPLALALQVTYDDLMLAIGEIEAIDAQEVRLNG